MPETQLAMTFSPEAMARSRHSDPETSKLAARHHEASGVAHERRLAIRRALEAASRPLTPAEIAERAGLDYVECQRRMSEVRRLGWIAEAGRTRCPLRGTMTRQWSAEGTK